MDDRDDIEAVLELWFGELDGPTDFDTSKNGLWWKGAEEDDRMIAARFGAVHQRAAAGELEAWAESARGRLALVLVLDQFSRCLGRGTAAAFENDARAQRHTIEAIEAGQDAPLRLIERTFLGMPLMHAEDRELQERSVAHFTALDAQAASIEGHPKFGTHALQHAEIVRRFGRYPHRNAILGRESTEAERGFLEDGGPSFGQKKR